MNITVKLYSDKNIKLTTQDNLELFKAMLDSDDNVIDDQEAFIWNFMKILYIKIVLN